MKKLLSLLLALTLVLSFTSVVSADSKVSMDKCTISFSKDSYKYTGNGITPTPKVIYKKKSLKKDKDYNIYYKDNVNVGTATVTLVGLGDYTGSTTATFTITKGTQEIRNAEDISCVYGCDPINIPAAADNPLSFKSSNTKVAEVSQVGVLTIKGAGKAKITITAEGTSNYGSAKKVITVTVGKAKSSVTAYGGKVKKGETLNLHAGATSDGKLTYTSSNKKVATVSSKGVVKGKEAGKVIITVKVAATANYKAASTKVEVEVQ